MIWENMRKIDSHTKMESYGHYYVPHFNSLNSIYYQFPFCLKIYCVDLFFKIYFYRAWHNNPMAKSSLYKHLSPIWMPQIGVPAGPLYIQHPDYGLGGMPQNLGTLRLHRRPGKSAWLLTLERLISGHCDHLQ